MRYLVGVDEAGRGPLAGPVFVGAVVVPVSFDVLAEFPGVRDSKQLSPMRRKALYEELLVRERAGDVHFCVRFSTHTCIDAHGIACAVHRAAARAVTHLAPSPEGVRVLLDGLLHAPSRYEQETIARGDALVPLISLASIAAKVRRDHHMAELARKHARYGFEVHKGYPTRAHRDAIRRFGLSDVHRVSYSAKFAVLR